MNNNDLEIDEIAKTMANALKKLTEAFGSFNEEKIKEILKQSIKPTLSEAERVILENIDKDYKWIARDKDGSLWAFIVEPEKAQQTWFKGGRGISINVFNHLFQFIKWEDEEPYNIEKLLKQ